MSDTLTTVETARFTELEGVVERGLGTFVEVGVALAEIGANRLYRQTNDTFEDYCRERWDLSRSHAYRMIDAAEVVAALSPMGDTPTERVARELAPLKNDPERMRDTWEEAVTEYGPKPTANQVRVTVDRSLAAKPKPRAPRQMRGPIQRPGLSHDPAVVEWVRQRVAEGLSRAQIIEASAQNLHDWPRPDEVLAPHSVTECRAIIVHLERLAGSSATPPPGRKPVTASLIEKQAERAQADRMALRLVGDIVGSTIELRKAREQIVGALRRQWEHDPYGVIAIVANLTEAQQWLDEVITPGMELLDADGQAQVQARAAR